jgi:fructosamine-3-kinase
VPLPEHVGGRAVRTAARIRGGDINEAFRCELEDGTIAFVKTRDGASPAEWRGEAAGLRWLGEADAVGVPDVLGVGDTWLALAWIDVGGAPRPDALGRGLALLHRAGADQLGAPWAYRLGSIVLSNDPMPAWPRFYAERRLRPLARVARDRGALDAAGAQAVERVCERIDDLCGPPEPWARLHGDLWSGNVLGDAGGRPWLVDPAAHGGHREVDLAMLQLFGSPTDECWAAYDEVWPRADGHEDRVALFQMLPLLAHAVLFGGSYGASAARAARRYAA